MRLPLIRSFGLLGVSQSRLSFHPKTLKEAALVKPRQQGRWIDYSLNLL